MRQETAPRGDGAQELARLFAAAIDDPKLRPAFRQTICDFTDDRKKYGDPVERVVVQLKHVIAQSSPTTRHLRLTTTSLTAADELTTAAVRWCIERYFEHATSNRHNRDAR